MAQPQQQQQPHSPQTQPKHQHYAEKSSNNNEPIPPIPNGGSPTEVVVQLDTNSNSSTEHCDPTVTSLNTSNHYHHHPSNAATMSRLQETTTHNNTSGPKSTSTGHRLLRRAFTLPRNPFQRLSSRKIIKVNGGLTSTHCDLEQSNGTYVRTNGTIEAPLLISQQNGGGTLGRAGKLCENDEKPISNGERRTRGSWKKIIGRLAQQMTNVGVGIF